MHLQRYQRCSAALRVNADVRVTQVWEKIRSHRERAIVAERLNGDAINEEVQPNLAILRCERAAALKEGELPLSNIVTDIFAANFETDSGGTV